MPSFERWSRQIKLTPMAKKKKSAREPSRLRLTLPATSANLGPAFDAAALALDLYLTVDARPAEEFSIAATGRDREICQAIENHLILTTYREVLSGEGKSVVPLVLRIDNDIPIGKGCGSSAAARLAGIALANHFGRLRWTVKLPAGETSLEWTWGTDGPRPAAAHEGRGVGTIAG